MATTRGLSWDDSKSKATALIAAVALMLTTFAAAVSPAPVATAAERIEIVVQETMPESDAAETLVERLGGAIGDHLALIGGFTATIPATSLEAIDSHVSTASVTENASLQFSGAGWDDGSHVNFNPSTYSGSVTRVSESILGVVEFWQDGHTGEGVDVALIDTGVLPVNGLTYPGKVINGPDLSFESQHTDFEYLDTYGHGTHLAGIIAGRDDGVDIRNNTQDFLGVAPGSRIVNVKVAGHDGAVDVSQVIAAIDWVVQHRNDNGLNIRVLNLAFGTDSKQPYELDPLAFAVEQAWNAGIVVVVAAGNDGKGAKLRNPASDPYVIAVGATNSGKTRPKIKQVLNFSNCGNAKRHVDLVVPGESIAGLRAPGTRADVENPESVVAGRYMLGSGTSQSAAFVSGMVALILDRSPEATPDQVKELLIETATGRFRSEPDHCVGAGLPNLERVSNRLDKRGLPRAEQTHEPSTGLGSLEGARGTDHLEHDRVVLEGEQDIFGNAWDGTSWSTAAAQGTSWSGGEWNGTSWSGTSWSGTSWSGTSWSGTSWSGTSWSGTSWSGTSWSDQSWNGTSWSGTSWSGTSWSGTSWSGTSWS